VSRPERNGSAGLLLAAGLAVLAAAPAAGQTAYGLRWYGEVRSPATPRTLALGGLTAVVPWGDPAAPAAPHNPALAAFGDQVLFRIDWELGHLSGDYPDGNGSLWQTGPRGMGLTAPLGRGIAVLVGLQSLTLGEFEVHTDATLFGEVPVQRDYLGKGGLSAGSFGAAWRSGQGGLAVGAAVDLIFGAIKQEWRLDFEPSGYLDSNDRLQRQHRGHRLRGGLQVVPLGPLRLGAAVTLPATLDVDLAYVSRGAGSDTVTTRLELGGAISIGAGLDLGGLWSAYLDGRREGWDRLRWKPEPVVPVGIGIAPGELDELRPEWSLGVGVERRARPADEQVTLLDTLPLRAGLRWGELYAPDLAQGKVTTWSATLGTGFFLGRRRLAWGDLALQIGRRRGADGSGEGFWRIQIGLSGGEKWFQPPQR